MENSNPEVKETKTAETAEKPVEKTFTQDQVEKIITKRLERERKNQAEELDKARDEATKLAKMNADQKKDYELEKALKSAKESQAKLALYEMRDTARQMLNDNDLALSDEQLDLVVTDDAETTKKNVETLAAIAKEIREGIRSEFRKGATPRTNNSGMTREQIEKIQDPYKRLKLIKQNIDLFND